jgi:hypothetical protein
LLPQNQDVAIRLEDPVPDGLFVFPIKVHRLFPAAAGARTYYLNGQEGSINQNYSVHRAELTAIFIPAAYGAVATATLEGGSGGVAIDQASAAAVSRERALREQQAYKARAGIPVDLDRRTRWPLRDGDR